MAGRTNRIPKCPVCGTLLSTDRTIDEQWVRRHPDPDLWVYRLACAQCLSVARVEIPEVSAVARSEPSRAVVDITGSFTARLLERIGAASGPDEIIGIIATVAADPEQQVLLRIPEVLGRTRSVYQPRVRVRDPLLVDSPMRYDSVRPTGRIVLAPLWPATPMDVVHGDVAQLRLASGRELSVLGTEGGALLLEPPRDDPELSEWLTDVKTLVAWPDYVEPIPRESD